MAEGGIDFGSPTPSVKVTPSITSWFKPDIVQAANFQAAKGMLEQQARTNQLLQQAQQRQLLLPGSVEPRRVVTNHVTNNDNRVYDSRSFRSDYAPTDLTFLNYAPNIVVLPQLPERAIYGPTQEEKVAKKWKDDTDRLIEFGIAEGFIQKIRAKDLGVTVGSFVDFYNRAGHIRIDQFHWDVILSPEDRRDWRRDGRIEFAKEYSVRKHDFKVSRTLKMTMDKDFSVALSYAPHYAGQLFAFVAFGSQARDFRFGFVPTPPAQSEVGGLVRAKIGDLRPDQDLFIPTDPWPIDTLREEVLSDALRDSIQGSAGSKELIDGWSYFLEINGRVLPKSVSSLINVYLGELPPIKTKRRKKT